MTIPTYDKFVEPILRFLSRQPEGASARAAHEVAAAELGLSETDRQQLVPSGTQLVYKNRAGWAHDLLKRAGLSASLRHGHWQLTSRGFEFAAQHPEPLSDEEVERLASEFRNVRLRGHVDPSSELRPPEDQQAASAHSAIASPDDRLGEAIAELRDSVAAELLDVLHGVSPSFFETIVLDLLHKMGYGTSRADLQRVGGSGDGGIDGVIALDKLGLEKVYVQAKRWQKTVGRPEVQAFYGALAGQRAKKGVFIATALFTPHALEFARSVEGVVLIDGFRLAQLMMDFEVGVTSRSIRVPKIDSDYFDE